MSELSSTIFRHQTISAGQITRLEYGGSSRPKTGPQEKRMGINFTWLLRVLGISCVDIRHQTPCFCLMCKIVFYKLNRTFLKCRGYRNLKWVWTFLLYQLFSTINHIFDPCPLVAINIWIIHFWFHDFSVWMRFYGFGVSHKKWWRPIQCMFPLVPDQFQG